MWYGILIILCGALGVWEVMLLPNYVEDKIRASIKIWNAEIIRITLLSRRDCIFLVEYQQGKNIIRKDVKYNLFGKIKWI